MSGKTCRGSISYYDFLVRQGGLDIGPCMRYDELWRFLFEYDFRVVVPNDMNRVIDTYEIRRRYRIRSNNYQETIETGVASVLEVLVAFAQRIDLEYVGIPGEYHPERVIYEMILNLEFDRWNKTGYGRQFVEQKLNRWLDRVYTRKGIGGAFPINTDPRDQRELELWEQMISYIHEGGFS